MMCLVVSEYSKSLPFDAAFHIKHVPHKLRVVGRRVIRDCWSNRTAQVVESADGERLSYSYLGGGLEWDPPHAYGLVFRGVPLYLADRLVAMLHFFTKTHVDEQMFGLRPSSDPSRKKSPTHKEQAVQKRVISVNLHLRSLRTRFKSRFDFLKLHCNFDLSHSNPFSFEPHPREQLLRGKASQVP